MRVYISGPITGITGYKPRFDWAESLWKDKGAYTINPAKTNSTLPEDTTHDGYMRISLALLAECDTIYMLRGWKDSEGAREELAYAVEHEYTIMFENRIDNVLTDVEAFE